MRRPPVTAGARSGDRAPTAVAKTARRASEGYNVPRWRVGLFGVLSLFYFLSGIGAFSYARPDLGNVPAWLPGLYLQGAPLAIDLVASFVKPRVRG